MPDLTETEELTFGFEAEFSSNATTLTRDLHRNGFVGMDRLHSYHCDCDECSIDGDYMLRAQQDSSCSGELISSVFTSTPSDLRHFLAVCEAIQEAAFRVDAYPGQSAGFHVHVGGGPHAEALAYGFVLAEAALMKVISPGALKMQRPFNESSSWGMLTSFDGYLADYGLEMAKDRMYDVIGQAWHRDRHSNLWHSGRYDTNEFRLWNSTAAAWRMEMFVRCSLAMSTSTFLEGTQEEVTEALECWSGRTRRRRNEDLSRIYPTGEWAGSWSVEKTIERIGAVDDRAAELLERQASFHTKNKEILPLISPNQDGDLVDVRAQADLIGDATERSHSSVLLSSRATTTANAVYTSQGITFVRWSDLVDDEGDDECEPEPDTEFGLDSQPF